MTTSGGVTALFDPDRTPPINALTQITADCAAAGGTPTDVLHAIAWAVTARAGWNDARHTMTLSGVLDKATFIFDCVAYEHQRNTGIEPYPDDTGLDDLTAEHRPDFFLLVVALSSDGPADAERDVRESARARLDDAYSWATEHGTSVVSAMCIAAEELALEETSPAQSSPTPSGEPCSSDPPQSLPTAAAPAIHHTPTE
ncbi:hypothetical protein [Sphaerisporangium sp. NPDC051011]|uniref:hypothetical protein n=1 Tax=Sphaerisporangium sp. NPDC051011 TaxID=3155792 RepID=UPI0033C207C8